MAAGKDLNSGITINRRNGNLRVNQCREKPYKPRIGFTLVLTRRFAINGVLRLVRNLKRYV